MIDTCGYVPKVVRASVELLADHVEHYTFISTCSVYRDTSVPGIDETYPLRNISQEEVCEAERIKPDDPIIARAYGVAYGALKALCEKAAEECMPSRVLNVRCGLIVGPFDYSDRFTYWPMRIAAGGEVLAPGRSDTQLQFVDVRDLAEWIVRMSYTTTGFLAVHCLYMQPSNGQAFQSKKGRSGGLGWAACTAGMSKSAVRVVDRAKRYMLTSLRSTPSFSKKEMPNSLAQSDQFRRHLS